MPKEGNRNVMVNFRMDEASSMLYCIITDNGIGRQASAEKKSNGLPQSDYVSKGLSLVYRRLQLLQAQMGRTFSSRIEDLVDEDGNGLGTRVEVMMFTGF